MKSKTSFFNKTLYVKNLTRYWPLWGLTAFFGALIPISGIMMYLDGELHNLDALDWAEVYYGGVSYFAPLALLFYSILCAMAVWSYLYNARSVGMMHTLPISREGLFLTNFLSGLTMVAIPWVVVAVLCVILMLISKSFSAVPLLVTILCVFGEGVFYFSSATAAAFVTGNAFALPLLYFLFHFLAPMLDFLITQFSSNMIFGLQSRVYTGVVDWLSPTVYIMKNVRPNSVYTERPIPGYPNATESVLQSVTLEKPWIIALYALVGLALLGVAYVLYRYRKSECAGEVIAMSWGRPVFRYGISALFALGGGQLLYVILFNSFDIDSNTYRILPLICCMLIAGLIGYYAASMALAKTLRVFNKDTRRGVVVIAAGCVVVCCVVGFDLLGVSRRVPSVDDINYVRLYTANNTYYLFPGEDSAVIEEFRNVQKTIIANRDYIRNALKSPLMRGETDFSQYTYVTVRVCYYLKNGLTVDRNYPLFLSKERMAEPGTFDNLLDSFINGTEMKLRRLRFGDPRFVVEMGNISVQKRDQNYEFSSRELTEVLNAIAADARAGAWGNYTWFDEDDSTYAVNMFFWYSMPTLREQTGRGTDNIVVYLRPGMTNTIAALKKMNYLEDGDLITSAEMHKIWEERDMAGVDLDAATLGEIIYPTEAVTTETASNFEPSEPVTVSGGAANPNSAPQTPAESSAASSAN
ncbi:MAG: ABC transporter permease [Oscillibacter sp.]|nr:ABC transporter permease [Oscillibacter sp.]